MATFARTLLLSLAVGYVVSVPVAQMGFGMGVGAVNPAMMTGIHSGTMMGSGLGGGMMGGGMMGGFGMPYYGGGAGAGLMGFNDEHKADDTDTANASTPKQ